MTQDPFGEAYASAYDRLYQDKDYAAEVHAVEAAFETYADGPVRRVLDLGCGTGGHALPLARRGYDVTGIDLSPAMIAQARAKAEPSLAVTFAQGDLARLDEAVPDAGSYDAALILFAVLGYLPTNAGLRSALSGVRRALRPGGLLVFDGWYGPAVLADPPGERVRVIDAGDGQTIIRAASGHLDARHHRCTVDYRLWTLDGDRVIAHAEERHEMRFFFPLELDAALDAAGFEPVALGPFPHLDRDIEDGNWTFIAAARAV